MSPSWFSSGSSIVIKLEFGDVGFCGWRKTIELGKKPLQQGKNQKLQLVGQNVILSWLQ